MKTPLKTMILGFLRTLSAPVPLKTLRVLRVEHRTPPGQDTGKNDLVDSNRRTSYRSTPQTVLYLSSHTSGRVRCELVEYV